MQRAVAARADSLLHRQRVLDALGRQRVGQTLAPAPLAGVGGDGLRLGVGVGIRLRRVAVLRKLGLVEQQRLRHRGLAGGAELLVLEQIELLLEEGHA